MTGSVHFADGAVPTGESATIVFQPADAAGKPASGSLAADGTFELMTLRPGDGVRPGKYKVVLKILKNYREGTSAVAVKYGDPSTTPLEATVDADHTRIDLTIDR